MLSLPLSLDLLDLYVCIAMPVVILHRMSIIESMSAVVLRVAVRRGRGVYDYSKFSIIARRCLLEFVAPLRVVDSEVQDESGD